MKWTSLHGFSFKDLISIILTIGFITVIGFYIGIGIHTLEYPSALLELIKILVTPILWVISIYGGTEGLELLKDKISSSDSLNIPTTNNSDSNSV